MHFNIATLTLSLLATSSLTTAYVVDLFADQNCQVPAGSRNVWDDTCAELGGFQSFRVTHGGGDRQRIRAYSRNACAGPETFCNSADSQTGICNKAVNSAGGSNAMGSATWLCNVCAVGPLPLSLNVLC